MLTLSRSADLDREVPQNKPFRTALGGHLVDTIPPPPPSSSLLPGTGINSEAANILAAAVAGHGNLKCLDLSGNVLRK